MKGRLDWKSRNFLIVFQYLSHKIERQIFKNIMRGISRFTQQFSSLSERLTMALRNQVEHQKNSSIFLRNLIQVSPSFFSKNLKEIIAKRVNRYWVIPPIFLENFSGRIRTGMEGRLDWKSRKILIVLRYLSLDILPALKDGNSQMAIAP